MNGKRCESVRNAKYISVIYECAHTHAHICTCHSVLKTQSSFEESRKNNLVRQVEGIITWRTHEGSRSAEAGGKSAKPNLTIDFVLMWKQKQQKTSKWNKPQLLRKRCDLGEYWSNVARKTQPQMKVICALRMLVAYILVIYIYTYTNGCNPKRRLGADQPLGQWFAACWCTHWLVAAITALVRFYWHNFPLPQNASREEKKIKIKTWIKIKQKNSKKI